MARACLGYGDFLWFFVLGNLDEDDIAALFEAEAVCYLVFGRLCDLRKGEC